MKLIIDRREWVRGNGGSCLLRYYRDNEYNDCKKMCCLGFLALQSGAKEKDILNKIYPRLNDDIKWPKEFFNDILPGATISFLVRELIEINDSYLSESDREDLLKKRFADINIDVEFIH